MLIQILSSSINGQYGRLKSNGVNPITYSDEVF